MSLSQLIVTTDIANSNVGINNSSATDGSVTNSVALGNGQNVGIGLTAPLTGLHIGNSGSVIPALYVKDFTGSTMPTIATGDGVFSSLNGVPTFTNSAGSQSLFTVSTEEIGTATMVAGTVTVTSAAVTPSSVILLTRTTTLGNVTTIGTISAVAGTGTFTVSSTVAIDIGSFNYLVMNL